MSFALDHFMDRASDFTTANDNDPTELFPRGDAVGFRALLLDKQREYHIRNAGSLVMELSSEVRHSHISLGLSLIVWLAAVTACIWSFVTGQSVGLRIFASMATIWTALWSAYLAKGLNKPRLGELTVLTALMGFVGIMLPASTQMGLPLQTSGGIGFFAIAALLVAWLTFSRIGLMTSVSACLGWAALHYDGYLVPSTMVFLLPLIIVGQIWLGARLRSRTAVFGAVIAAYVWLGGFIWKLYSAGDLSALFLAAGTVLIGGAHLQISKAAEDEGVESMTLHIMFAWGLLIFALIAIQHYALTPEHKIWVENAAIAPLVKAGWALLCAGTLGLIGLAALTRRRHGRITFPAAILMVSLYALIPLAIWFEPELKNMFTYQTGLKPHPAFGMFLGGIITAAAFMFSLNNLRRGRRLLAIAGLGVIALEADLMLKGSLMQFENIAILIAGLCIAGGIIGIIAQAQFDPRAPQHPLQSMNER